MKSARTRVDREAAGAGTGPPPSLVHLTRATRAAVETPSPSMRTK